MATGKNKQLTGKVTNQLKHVKCHSARCWLVTEPDKTEGVVISNLQIYQIVNMLG